MNENFLSFKQEHEVFVSGLSNKGIQNTPLPKKVEQQTIELNEEFYSDLDDLYFLLNSSEKIGLTDKEKQVVTDEINRRIQDAIEVDAVNFVGMIYYRHVFDLEKCLPKALQEATRKKNGIPEKNKQNLIKLINEFKNMTLKEKITYLEDPRTWGYEEDKNGYVYGDLRHYSSSLCSYDDDYDSVEHSPLYSALTLLDEIREQGQDR